MKHRKQFSESVEARRLNAKSGYHPAWSKEPIEGRRRHERLMEQRELRDKVREVWDDE